MKKLLLILFSMLSITCFGNDTITVAFVCDKDTICIPITITKDNNIKINDTTIVINPVVESDTITNKKAKKVIEAGELILYKGPEKFNALGAKIN